MGIRRSILVLSALLPLAGLAADPDRTYFVPTPTPPESFSGVAKAVYSDAVRVGNTLYIGGTIDIDPATGKPGTTPEESAKLVMDSVKEIITKAGFTLDDLVWVQVYCSDIASYQSFNRVYETYFRGNKPARSFVGVDHLLADAHFEIMGTAVRKKH